MHSMEAKAREGLVHLRTFTGLPNELDRLYEETLEAAIKAEKESPNNAQTIQHLRGQIREAGLAAKQAARIRLRQGDRRMLLSSPK